MLSNSRELEIPNVQDAYDRESTFGLSMSAFSMENQVVGTVPSSKKRDSSLRFSVSSGPRKYGDTENGENVTYTYNPSSQKDANALAAGCSNVEAEKRAISEFWVTHWLNSFCFGSGTRKWVPLMWQLSCLVAVIYNFILLMYGERNLIGVVLFSIVFANLASSLYFGWHMARTGYVEDVIRLSCHTANTEICCRKVLGRFVGGAMIIVLTCYSLFIIGSTGIFMQLLQIHSLTLNISISVAAIFETNGWICTFIFFISTFYLIAIWIWTCWLKHQVSCAVADSVSLESVSNGSFMERFLDASQWNSMISDTWKVKHIINFLVSGYCRVVPL